MECRLQRSGHIEESEKRKLTDKMTERRFTCLHCKNYAHMDIIATGNIEIRAYDHESAPIYYHCYDTLMCPRCERPSLRTYYYSHDVELDEAEVESVFLYPEDMSSVVTIQASSQDR